MEESREGPSTEDVVWRRLEDQLDYYRTRSNSAKNAYKSVKLVQIVVGAVIPVLAAAGATGWVTALVAAVPIAAEGAQQLFQWHSNWLRWRAAAETLKNESFLYMAQVGPYVGEDRRRTLAERVSSIIERETGDWAANRYSEIEQTPRTREAPLAPEPR
ncbi:DUF4231 domain-containing protein [Nocardia carnea]|uniref:DUF4231 domain-containing protein n=1 Tax=Nocardia carnea TaxID=37328 RepID=UPI003D780346